MVLALLLVSRLICKHTCTGIHGPGVRVTERDPDKQTDRQTDRQTDTEIENSARVLHPPNFLQKIKIDFFGFHRKKAAATAGDIDRHCLALSQLAFEVPKATWRRFRQLKVWTFPVRTCFTGRGIAHMGVAISNLALSAFGNPAVQFNTNSFVVFPCRVMNFGLD